MTPQGLLNGDDNFFVLAASTMLTISQEGDYTFGFSSDDGAQLRVLGAVFTSATDLGGGNFASPPFRGDTLAYPAPTAISTTLGVTHLKPGTYPLEFIMYEEGGATFAEVFVAQGVKSALDSSFQLLSPNMFSSAPAATLSFAPISATQAAITWTFSTACDRLQSAPSVTGPWTDMPGATSGQVVSITGPAAQFYRVAR